MTRESIDVNRREQPLDLTTEQTRNNRGSVVWSDRVVVCPRCGSTSLLTLAAALRDDWDQSLTCCPLPALPRLDKPQPLGPPHCPRELHETSDAVAPHREAAEPS